ncbi:MAG TPA: SDR family NAD(P)-dependent oxidoreductase [Gaiellales bacterium]
MTQSPFDFGGRVALVTGCGSESGIGQACARLLARLGATVAVTATTDRVQARAGELRALGAEASAHVADLTVRDQAFALVAAAAEAHGRIDVLINSAGIAQTGIPAPDAAFADMTEAQWRRELDVNLMTAVHTSQAVLPGMVSRGYGRIVMISSVTGPLVMAPRQAGYGAAKGAMDAVMRSIALDYGRGGITANSVAPGWIDTASSLSDELVAARSTPVGRAGTPEEAAVVAVFLASEAAAYVTGQVFVVDGGNTIQEPHGIDLYGDA